MTEEKAEFTTCRVCGKATRYKKCLGHICWKCKRNGPVTGTNKPPKPVRCPECGHKITIVPCIACTMQGRLPNAKKET